MSLRFPVKRSLAPRYIAHNYNTEVPLKHSWRDGWLGDIIRILASIKEQKHASLDQRLENPRSWRAWMDPKYKAFIYASWSWSLWAWWSQRTLSWIMILVVHGENHIDDAWMCCMKVLFWSCRMSFCGELHGCSRLPMTLHTSSMWWTTEAWAVRWMSSVGITRMQEPKSFFQRWSLYTNKEHMSMSQEWLSKILFPHTTICCPHHDAWGHSCNFVQALNWK